METERTVFYFCDDHMPCETNYMENLHWTLVLRVKTSEQWHVERILTGVTEWKKKEVNSRTENEI